MTETNASSWSARAELARSLAAALSAADGTLVALLLQSFESLDAMVTIKDLAGGRYLYVNARMASLFDRQPETMVGQADTEWMEAAQATALRVAEQAAAGQGSAFVNEHRVDLAGQKRDFRVTRFAVPRTDGAAPRHVCSVWVELTQSRLREAQSKAVLGQLELAQTAIEQLRRETQDRGLHDGATGLYQRAQFEDQLRREVDLSSREHREFALVTITLDPPSEAASGLGEPAQLRVLEALGRLLRSNTRAMDASCRLDVDRFAVLLSGVGLATAHSRMEGLRRQCATQIVVLDGRDLGFTVSMGVASFPHTAHTQEDLMKSADLALAEAQKRGGNHVALASIRFALE